MSGANVEAHQKRFAGFGWHTIVIDGHKYDEILSAFEEAARKTDQPTAILAHTVKGKGVSFLEDKEGWHGKPLKKGEELDRALEQLAVNGASPHVPVNQPAKISREGTPAPGPMGPPRPILVSSPLMVTPRIRPLRRSSKMLIPSVSSRDLLPSKTW
jgi:transketolase